VNVKDDDGLLRLSGGRCRGPRLLVHPETSKPLALNLLDVFKEVLVHHAHGASFDSTGSVCVIRRKVPNILNPDFLPNVPLSGSFPTQEMTNGSGDQEVYKICIALNAGPLRWRWLEVPPVARCHDCSSSQMYG
jgi:hypothetical protein